MLDQADSVPAPRRRLGKRLLLTFIALLLVWAVIAYLLIPGLWLRYTRRHPSLEDLPRITYTKDGIHGDPLNVALTGTHTDVMKAMIAAKWYPADALNVPGSSSKSPKPPSRNGPMQTAPVSNLYLFGRKEDLAFERPVGHDPRKRHHVRFWMSEKLDADARPIWVGSAVYDEHVGFSKTTGQITHVTGIDIDAEPRHAISRFCRRR